jgi:hypothetical protein
MQGPILAPVGAGALLAKNSKKERKIEPAPLKI